jgi:WhiB family redox-sensing transcriptional regulator
MARAKSVDRFDLSAGERLVVDLLQPIGDWDAGGWRRNAACRHSDVRLFFPGRVSGAPRGVEAAKAVCRSCPVREECLHFAQTTNQLDGVWGGLDEVERRSARTSRQPRRTAT